MINMQVYRDTYRELREKNQTKIPFPEWMERMLDRNLKLRKQEFEERKVQLKHFDIEV